MWYYHYGNGYNWLGIAVSFFLWVVILTGIFVLLGLFLRSQDSKKPPAQQDDDSLAILKNRYARGEIDTKEYEERKKILETK